MSDPTVQPSEKLWSSEEDVQVAMQACIGVKMTELSMGMLPSIVLRYL